jgi:hypothetical protein
MKRRWSRQNLLIFSVTIVRNPETPYAQRLVLQSALPRAMEKATIDKRSCNEKTFFEINANQLCRPLHSDLSKISIVTLKHWFKDDPEHNFSKNKYKKPWYLNWSRSPLPQKSQQTLHAQNHTYSLRQFLGFSNSTEAAASLQKDKNN